MKKISIIIFILLAIISKQIKANDHIEISLLTCSEGKKTFSAWGHSAIRIVDTVANIDVVYNFGIFDFDTPHFYLKFIKGRLNYMLGAHRTDSFYKSYLRENRQIIEQKLNLTNEDEYKIIHKLEYLYQPENRYYLYSFVGKNCTSELRDLILENVKTDFQNTITNKTHRQQLNEFLQDRLWLRFSMSLIMGYKVDKKIDLFQSMFLPYYLLWEVRNIKTSNGNLVQEEYIFNEVDNSNTKYPLWANPLLLFSIVFVVILLFNKKYIQNSFLFIVGITGLVIFALSLITEHPELQYNLNILWLNPLYLILAFKLSKRPQLKKYLAYISQSLVLVMIPIWISKVQYFELTYLPILLILTLINFRIIKTKSRFN